MSKFRRTGKGGSLTNLAALFALGLLAQPDTAVAQNVEPLKVLMVIGGGPFHDYYTQKRQLERLRAGSPPC